MIVDIIRKLFGTNNSRVLNRMQALVIRINYLEAEMKQLTDAELSAKTAYFRQQIIDGKTLDDILPEAFAVVRETSRRFLGQRHYDVQLLGGITLHEGKISEMKTGEGKTLTATLALYLNALAGKGAHLVTVNDYLARRDANWMAPVFNHLGLTVGVLQHDLDDQERKKVYESDIVYATNNELGFDYLRDNMKFRLEDYVQRDLHYAIVDEVDSILIDEARTPLIISGSSDDATHLYARVNSVIPLLQPVVDFEVDEKNRTVQLTETGNDKVEAALQVTNLYDLANIKMLHHVGQALRAHKLFKRDVDYVVRDNQVLIVDEFTGRILSGRRYSDGLHQAIEAKEGVPVQRESQTVASITLQNYFRLYKKLAGMTGTAITEAEEFHKIYNLAVVSIPTHRPMIRDDKPDLLFLSRESKERAIAQDIVERHMKGQPVLIGTISVESSERLSMVLNAQNIPHEVLNAKNHAREAEIVACAGQKGRVTIATNMAGRGTDIKLTQDSLDAGGLYILGTERHESRRIDNQLRGRSGRQGDPGESRFYLSPDDNLIRIFGGETFKKRLQFAGMTEDESIESKFFTKNIERMQERVERDNFEIRKNLLEYDDVLNQQRTVIYTYRRMVLEGQEHIFDLIRDLIAETVEDLVAFHAQSRMLSHENLNDLFNALALMINSDAASLKEKNITQTDVDTLTPLLIDHILMEYNLYIEGRDQSLLQEAQKWLMLNSIDLAWKQHMLNLDHLKEGIGLRGMGQKNPLIEYKKEAYGLFADMMRSIRFEIIHHIFHLNMSQFDQKEFERERERELDEVKMSGGSENDITKTVTQARAENMVGRNDDCPCGSGKKFKKCHGK